MNKLLRSETTDNQLYTLATKVGLHLQPIVFVDELKYLPKPNQKKNYGMPYFNYVINLRNPAHWVALFLDLHNHILYYFNSFADNFGDVPPEIINFARSISCIIYKSDKPVQRTTTGFCGPYCIYWLYMMNRPTDDIYDFNAFLKKFVSTQKQIDYWLRLQNN